MTKIITTVVFVCLGILGAGGASAAQENQPVSALTGPGPTHTPVFEGASLETRTIDEPLHGPIDYPTIEQRIRNNLAALGIAEDGGVVGPSLARADATPLIFPVRATAASNVYEAHFISNYVDLDATGPGNIQDFSCRARSYDLASGYDHQGIDIVSGPFPAHAMNNEWSEVVAAAPGIIVDRNDGEPDRNCNGLNPAANYVVVLQDDGFYAYYWHLQINTPLGPIGTRVETGQRLGLVGSSGSSTEPHLHFEMRDGPAFGGVLVDPYAGACGANETLWQHQHDAIDTQIISLFTHRNGYERPNSFCQTEDPRFENSFRPGERVYIGYFTRDHIPNEETQFVVFDPAGNIFWSHNLVAVGSSGLPIPPLGFHQFARWSLAFVLPQDAQTGMWRIRSTFVGRIRERAFYVGTEPAEGARLAAATLPTARSVRAGQTATVFATVLNPSSVEAQGCWIVPGTPLDGRVEYRETDPATNAVIGEINTVFSIPPGGSRSFVVALTPEADAVARSYQVILRYKCDNSDAARQINGLNTVLMSFDATDTPDMVAIALTPTNDGVLRLAGNDGRAAFVVATANVGAAGELTVRPAALGATSSLRLRICETNTVTGACLAPAGDSVTRSFGAGETSSFAVFAVGQGSDVSFAPASNRISVEAVDAANIVRGSTGVAASTQ